MYLDVNNPNIERDKQILIKLNNGENPEEVILSEYKTWENFYQNSSINLSEIRFPTFQRKV
jgi:hypothetical protein